MFQDYEENDRSPFHDWLPIAIGLFAASIVALIFCPVPRSETISGPVALLLAFTYVALAVFVGSAALTLCSILMVAHQHGVSLRRPLALFCSVAAWIAPMVAFYQRNSSWAVSTACIVGVFGAALIHRHRFALSAFSMLPASTEPEPGNQRRLLLTIAAILLQTGALFVLGSMARPATLLVGAAVVIISLCYQSAIFPNPIRSRYQKPGHCLSAVVLAMIFVAASLTPYLAVEDGELFSDDTGFSSRSPTPRSGYRSREHKAGLLQYMRSLWQVPGGEHSRPKTHRAQGGQTSTGGPYPVLQALFGERAQTEESQTSSVGGKWRKRTSTVLVTNDSYPGMILRPLIDNHSVIIPPLAKRTVWDEKFNLQKDEPVSIPFYGAYWYYRASDGGLPADSIESRGDPASMSFKTTDFTPIAMEARQNFGTLIDLSCCRAVELIISNGDRRPGTVAVELILTNTRTPGKPQQSLGRCPVNSSLRWSPDEDRPPTTETLNFRIPSQAAIKSFDEVTIRFQMGSPRERWSAKIAVLKFRLIPQGL